MSGPLAIAAVTAVLKRLLEKHLDVLSPPARVTSRSPDQFSSEVGNAPERAPRLHLFLHHVSVNPGSRNLKLPSRSTGGRRLTNAPLALDLHYLLIASGVGELDAEVMLGQAMQALHEHPQLDPAVIHGLLDEEPFDLGVPEYLSNLQAKLVDEIEQIRLSLEPISTEELSKIWSAFQTPYRPTVAYLASVVLIEAREPTISALPVLTRRLAARASLVPPYPTISSVEYATPHERAHVGDDLIFHGHDLDGVSVEVVFRSPDGAPPRILVPGPGQSGATSIAVTIPGTAPAVDDWPVGQYQAQVRVTKQEEAVAVVRASNEVAVAIAPIVKTVVVSPGAPKKTVTVTVTPKVRATQSVSLFLGAIEHPGAVPDEQTDTAQLTFEVELTGTHLLRLRIDGIDSQVIDHSSEPPKFLATAQVTL